MGYELSITIKGGRVEIEADTVAELEKRVAALDLPRLEAAVQRARKGKGATKAARRRRPASR